MTIQRDKKSALRGIWEYFRNLPDQSPYWRTQAIAWGVVVVVLIAGGVLFALLALSSVYGGGSITYRALGSPGPVVFSHYAHMTFQSGKYKDCKTCHQKLFATQKFGTFVIRALKDTPPIKVHIGRNASTLYVSGGKSPEESALVTYRVPRACATCATGNCHNGKESFSRFECLKCHHRK
jgi:hypothetical protein